jgi:hypothetical protein
LIVLLPESCCLNLRDQSCLLAERVFSLLQFDAEMAEKNKFYNLSFP